MSLVLVVYAAFVQRERIILAYHVDQVKGAVNNPYNSRCIPSSLSSPPSPLPISTPSPAIFSTNSLLTVTPTTIFYPMVTTITTKTTLHSFSSLSDNVTGVCNACTLKCSNLIRVTDSEQEINRGGWNC